MLDHGGNLDEATARFGGSRAEWLDLSTGINRVPYAIPPLSDRAGTDLPSRADMALLAASARKAYHTEAAILPLAGAQAAIQMIPLLSAPGRARVLAPTYNEHAGVLAARGWTVEEVDTLGDLAGADLAVVVNPNNPDGRTHAPEALLSASGSVGRLIVDESFADAVPHLSVATQAGRNRMMVLRSFGKFYGLAGLRLGFVLGSGEDITALSSLAGPWPVCGAAIEAGIVALGDAEWKAATILRLGRDSERMDELALRAGWRVAGGTDLFRLYETIDAVAAQERLASARIWSRTFAYSRRWIRLGLPGTQQEWMQAEAAFSAL